MPSPALLTQAIVVGVLTGGVYALMASGLTLIFGVMRVINIAHGAFIVLSAYLTWRLWEITGLDPILTLVVTVPLFFVIGVLLQRFLLSRLHEDAASMSVLLTFAIAIGIEGLLGWRWTASFRSVRVDYATGSVPLFGMNMPNERVLGCVLAIAVFGILLYLLRYQRYGRALRASTQHEDAARLVGIDVDRVKAVGFGIGLSTAAVGGMILALMFSFFPATHYVWIGRLLTIIVLGGLGSIPGAAAAALLMGVVESVAVVVWGASWGIVMFYVVLFATLIFRPHGLFGGRLAERF
jgi:branched-chain amino acid transport system permease protein